MAQGPRLAPALLLGLVLVAPVLGCNREPQVVIQFPSNLSVPPPTAQAVHERKPAPGNPSEMNLSR